jgi:hypothetical protein
VSTELHTMRCGRERLSRPFGLTMNPCHLSCSLQETRGRRRSSQATAEGRRRTPGRIGEHRLGPADNFPSRVRLLVSFTMSPRVILSPLIPRLLSVVRDFAALASSAPSLNCSAYTVLLYLVILSLSLHAAFRSSALSTTRKSR